MYAHRAFLDPARDDGPSVTVEEQIWLPLAMSSALVLSVALVWLRHKLLTPMCHFCSRRVRVEGLRVARQGWMCPFDDCGQWNGFDTDGDYNISIPQLKEADFNRQMPIARRAGPSIYTVGSSARLCPHCECQQALLVQALSKYEFVTPSLRKRLESQYSLCRACNQLVAKRLETSRIAVKRMWQRARVFSSPLELLDSMESHSVRSNALVWGYLFCSLALLFISWFNICSLARSVSSDMCPRFLSLLESNFTSLAHIEVFVVASFSIFCLLDLRSRSRISWVFSFAVFFLQLVDFVFTYSTIAEASVLHVGFSLVTSDHVPALCSQNIPGTKAACSFRVTSLYIRFLVSIYFFLLVVASKFHSIAESSTERDHANPIKSSLGDDDAGSQNFKELCTAHMEPHSARQYSQNVSRLSDQRPAQNPWLRPSRFGFSSLDISDSIEAHDANQPLPPETLHVDGLFAKFGLEEFIPGDETNQNLNNDDPSEPPEHSFADFQYPWRCILLIIATFVFNFVYPHWSTFIAHIFAGCIFLVTWRKQRESNRITSFHTLIYVIILSALLRSLFHSFSVLCNFDVTNLITSVRHMLVSFLQDHVIDMCVFVLIAALIALI